MKHCSKGFTLLELMVVVAISGILAAIIWPNYTKWYIRTKSDNDARIVASDLQYAKISAVKENALVEIKIQTDGSITIKSNPGKANEKTLKSRKLEYLVCDSLKTLFFNTRGIPVKDDGSGNYIYISDAITIDLNNKSGEKTRSITVNIAGNIQIKKINN